MKTVKLIATAALKHYGAKVLKAGDEFDAEENDVHVLTVGGLAVKPVAPTPGRYRRRDMRADH